MRSIGSWLDRVVFSLGVRGLDTRILVIYRIPVLCICIIDGTWVVLNNVNLLHTI